MWQKSTDFFQTHRIFISLHPLRLDYHYVLDNFDKYQFLFFMAFMHEMRSENRSLRTLTQQNARSVY